MARFTIAVGLAVSFSLASAALRLAGAAPGDASSEEGEPGDAPRSVEESPPGRARSSTSAPAAENVPSPPAIASPSSDVTFGEGRAVMEESETGTSAQAMFVKGEITHAGSVRLIPKRSFVGLRVGFLLQEPILEDTTVFMTIAPKIDLGFLDRMLKVGVEVPLNLEFYSAREAANTGEVKGGFEHFGRLRKEDYDDARDYLKVLRYVSYGRKEDHFYFSMGQLHATTLGHGQVMRRYAANVDINSTKVGAEIDAYGDYAGFEFSLSDVTRANLIAGLAFVKPMALFASDPYVRTISIGVSWATDQKAPFTLRRREPVGVSPVGTVILDEFGTAPQVETRAVNIYGLDAEMKVFRTDSIDLKTYADFSKLIHAGSGATLGVLGRFNFRSGSNLHLLRTRFELRSYAPTFQPSYFDVLYEFQKYQYITDPNAIDIPTKLAYITGREGSRRFGVYVEASYALVDWFIFGIALETETAGEDQHLMLHVEVPFRFLDVFATYQQRSLRKLFTFDQNDVVFAGARLQLLPILFLNGRVQKNFVWDRSHLLGLGGYAENINYQLDGEFGFEF